MTRRGASWLAAGYLGFVLLVTFNVVLAVWATAHVALLAGGDRSNATGLMLLAIAGLVVLLWAAMARAGTHLQWWLAAALALWLVPVALSMSFHGALRDSRFWLMAVIMPAVGAAGMLVSPILLRRLLLGLGWIAGWGSVVAGLSCAWFGWPPALAGGEERFGRWLSLAGLDLGEVRFLNGLMLGRVYVGLTCGLLLVYTVRVLLGGGYAKWWWLSPVGMLFATAWAFSRTGLVIVVLGLLAALVPWERLRTWWLVTALFAVVMLPVLASPLLRQTGISDGTTVWRFDLWRDYVARSGMWTPFGIGPQPASVAYADHAHQQLLEAQATGGWLSLVGCIAFMVLGCLAARRAGDNRAAIAVLFGMAAIFQVDVVTFTNNYAVVNNAFVVIVAVLVSAAGNPASQSGVSEFPEQPLDVVEDGIGSQRSP